MIDVEGDSTIWGQQLINGAPGRTEIPTPAILQADLQKTDGTAITTVNNGVPNSTVHESLYGIAPLFSQPLTTRLATAPTQVVVANYGINDSAYSKLPDYIADLNAWIDVVKGNGKIPVLEEPNPTCTAATADLPKFVDAMNQVAQERGVSIIQQYAYIQSLPNWQSMLTDCIHPSDALYKIKADREAAVLNPIVQRLMQP
ncbi:SGNH/GDSL hydrolase family protein [Burkholderia cepacia]|uniref:SGNH/GDSL hydrolase family protein n=1 Tax=Burkholderia cepacia TaxID=292 RepID=UPI001F44A3D7|nr:SGNH/GDSL hydrolase family protein [Burkholderia cepacia]MCE4125362.1 SGNH/GDSL hydrolase family protein [Burkholderia cepacia]